MGADIFIAQGDQVMDRNNLIVQEEAPMSGRADQQVKMTGLERIIKCIPDEPGKGCQFPIFRGLEQAGKLNDGKVLVQEVPGGRKDCQL
jgi:hypothetical protein